MFSVCIVEDCVDSYLLAKRALGASVHLEWAKSISEATHLLSTKPFDLIILDITLPDGDGFRLCSILKANEKLQSIPVIFLTGRSTVADKVLGFSTGAQDFVTKPFEPMELRARVDALLRRRQRELAESDIVRIGVIEIDKSRQKVSVDENGSVKDVGLTPLEFKLLLCLAKIPNHVFSRNDVLNAVWGENVYVYSRSVDTHVSKLRKKLGTASVYIESVHGTGYKLNVDEPRDFANLGGSLRLSGSSLSEFMSRPMSFPSP